MKIEEALARILRVEGVETVFGLMDVYNMDFLVALEPEGIKLVRGRHEHGVVCMADGYWRVSGKLGVCSVGAGPALTQIGTALTNAQKHGSSLLVIFPDTPATERHNLKRFNAKDFVESMGVKYVRVRAPSTFVEDTQLALRHIYGGKGPAVLDVPLDLLQHEAANPFEYNKIEMPDVHLYPSQESVTYAAYMLRNAKRPLILAGRGAVAANSRPQLEALADRTGALLGNTLPAKDYFGDHPFNVGIVGTHASDAAVRLVTQADCVLAVGASLTRFTTVEGKLFAKANVVQVDANPDKLGDTYPIRLGILGDATATAEAIQRALAEDGREPQLGFRTEETRDMIAQDRVKKHGPYVHAEGKLDPNEVVDALNDLLPPERMLVGGGFFESEGIRVPSPRAFVPGLDFAALGLALPLGVGAAMGNPKLHSVCCLGDGNFLMCPQELDTAVRHRVNMTIVIMNNQAYGAEVRVLENKGRPIESALFETPNLADIATSYGAVGRKVQTMDQLRAAAKEVGKYDRPLVLDVDINLDVVHRMWLGKARLTG